MSDTPETDAMSGYAAYGETQIVNASFARRLERERNSACTLTEEEINELKSHSTMLGQIAGYVSNFCEEQTTTLQAVMMLKAYWLTREAEIIYEKLDQ